MGEYRMVRHRPACGPEGGRPRGYPGPPLPIIHEPFPARITVCGRDELPRSRYLLAPLVQTGKEVVLLTLAFGGWLNAEKRFRAG